MYTNPTVAEFKTFFARDFIYNANPALGITDTDIQNALDEAICNINPDLFLKQEQYTLGCLLLAAHFLCLAITSASTGTNGNFEGFITSKSVGNVSTSSQIPDRFLKDAILSLYARTTYGVRYLQLILPFLSGNVFSVAGRTHA